MDTSLRFYTTNSSWGSSTEDDSLGHPAKSLAADKQNDDGLVNQEEEQAETLLSDPLTMTQPEQVNIADFESIFLRYQGPITNFIYHLLGNREQAYDLAQDVFVKAYRALLGGTIVQPGALSAWLYRIATNTTTDTLRRRRLISWLPLSLFNEDRGIGAGVVSEPSSPLGDGFNSDDQSSDPRSNAASALYERNSYDGGRFESRVADREIVERVFRQLPQKYASCLWLYQNDGFSCTEIAQILHISASAVKMRLMRARERFISLYQEEVSED